MTGKVVDNNSEDERNNAERDEKIQKLEST